MISWDQATTVDGPGAGSFVVRSRPAGASPEMAPAAGGVWYFLVTKLRHRLKRNRPWTVTVRRAEDDPLGPPIFVKDFPTRAAAMAGSANITDQLRSGEWEPDSPSR